MDQEAETLSTTLPAAPAQFDANGGATRVTVSGDGGFPVWESRLPEYLGPLSRPVLRKLRTEHLKEGEDWTRTENERVCLSLAAVEKLRVCLQVPPAPEKTTGGPSTASGGAGVTPDSEKLAALAEPPPIETLNVVKTRIVNRRLILCCRPENPTALLRVQVRDNLRYYTHLPNGQPLTVQARQVQGDLYEVVGPAPRGKHL